MPATTAKPLMPATTAKPLMPATTAKPLMPAAEFKAMKARLRKQRRNAMHDLVHKLGLPDAAEPWITDVPKGPPPPELDAYCVAQGDTVAVHASKGPGLTAQAVFFARGDMISYAAGRAHAGKHVGVLNMANAYSVGGGFMSGARAQEEQLCHRSALFPRIKQYRWYDNYPIQPGTCLLTPNVDIVLCGAGQDFAPMDKPATVAVLSAAATHYTTEDDAKENQSLTDELVETWLAIFAAAAASRIEELVVSALGAGAFNNPPEAVGEAFGRALLCCSRARLESVHVIILEDHNSLNNYERFEAGFKQVCGSADH